jgi:ribonuclease Z
MIEIAFLGTGGAMSTADRDNTSFFFDNGKNLILVDCPGSALQKIQKLGGKPEDLAAILITHVHPDHVYGLPAVFHSLMLQEGLIPIYGSEETVRFCVRLLDLFGLRQPQFKTRSEFQAVRPDEDFFIADGVTVTALPVTHHPSSLAFHFHFGEGGRFLYSGDTAAAASPLKRAHGLDSLGHDCSAPSRFFEEYPVLYSKHTNSLELGRMAEETGVKTLFPCHFFGEVEFSLTEIEEEIRRHYTGRLIIPRDLERYPL